MELVIILGTGGTENCESIRLIILRPGFYSHLSFGHWLKFLTNLANLTNLLSRNLVIKTQLKHELGPV